jgi:hypothetical protein
VLAYEVEERSEVRRKQQCKPAQTGSCECSPRSAGLP